MSAVAEATPKAGHEVDCPKCSHRFMIACDKRQRGQGHRARRLGFFEAKWSPNKEAVFGVMAKRPEEWYTVRQVQRLLYEGNVPHNGKTSGWNYTAVQTVLSALVGELMAVEMRPPEHGCAWQYRVGSKFPSERYLDKAHAEAVPLAQPLPPPGSEGLVN